MKEDRNDGWEAAVAMSTGQNESGANNFMEFLCDFPVTTYVPFLQEKS